MHAHSKGLLVAPGSNSSYKSFALSSLGASGTAWGMVLLTAIHIWLATFLPPAEDELYYWSWAQTLQMSYYDHPPITAYLIRLSTALFGDSIFALRLPAVLTSLAVMLMLLKLTHRSGLVWLVFLCPIVFYGSVLMTPDLPLVFFWLVYAIWLSSTNARLDSWSHDPVSRVYSASPVPWPHWILGGILLGLGALSKYTMALAVPCTLVVLGTRTQFRAWGVGFVLHLLVAGILVLPIFIFNVQHDFLPLSFQWHHSMNASGSFAGFRKFVGDQIILFGALPFLMLPWVLMRAKDLCADARSQVYFWFFVLPFFFFVYKAFRTPLEANWAVVSYLTFWPLADRLLSWSSFRGINRALLLFGFAVPVVATGIVFVHLLRPFQHPGDRVSLLRARFDTAEQVAAHFKAEQLKGPLFLTNYQWTSYFRFLGVPSEQIVPAGRNSHFTLNAQGSCSQESVLALDDHARHIPALACFPNRQVLKEFVIAERGREWGRVWLSRYTR